MFAKSFIPFFALIGGLVLFPSGLSAMEPLAEAEMEEMTAGGFSSFSWVGDTARFEFDVSVSTYMEINEFRADDNTLLWFGHWAQHWEDVRMGQSTQVPLQLNDFVLDVEFLEVGGVRQLLGLKAGFKDVTGTLSADFKSLSKEGFGLENRYATSPGQETYVFTNDPLMIHIKTLQDILQGEIPAVWVDFGDAQKL